MEKSRHALSLYRAAYPSPSLGPQSTDQGQLQALWKIQPRSSSAETFAPFIVPSVLDYLRSSKWSKKVFIVPGEADTFCAFEARQKCAAILTNDSDLVLFEGVETVLLISSLELNQAQQSMIQGRCWQPQKIAEQVGIPTMSLLGFARYKHATGSLNAVVQSAREFAQEYNAEIEEFKSDFDLKSDMPTSLVLDDLDPRFAEVVYQISRPVAATRLEMTLPVLLEDPTRDAAWSYGKDTRRLAYTMLVKGFTSSRSTEVVEYFRKGPAIAPTIYAVLQGAEFEQHSQRLLKRIEQYSLNLDYSDYSWIACALHEVWSQRIDAGRNVFTAHVLSVLLGLVPLPIDGRSTNLWEVIHLNANIQAILYSMRLLKQAMMVANINCSRQRYRGLESLIEALDHMPKIEHVFRTPIETREIFQQLPREELQCHLQPFLQEFALTGVLGMRYVPKTDSPQAEKSIDDKKQEEFIVAEGKRKRGKKQKTENANRRPASATSLNMFDVLSSSSRP